ncbi:MAG: hypothetical protein HC887_10100 [Desulfobacteraceae bacterium]|nr:hypothetical protein [Desulfobacteraceae bacterium]
MKPEYAGFHTAEQVVMLQPQCHKSECEYIAEKHDQRIRYGRGQFLRPTPPISANTNEDASTNIAPFIG